MAKEAYCSFEVAKLLKEKGFDEPIFKFYSYKGEVLYSKHPSGLRLSDFGDNKCNYYPYITHQMALSWLREQHIFIEISVAIDLNGNYHYRYSVLDKECKYLRQGWTNLDWKYEDAIEEALKYSLENLI